MMQLNGTFYGYILPVWITGTALLYFFYRRARLLAKTAVPAPIPVQNSDNH